MFHDDAAVIAALFALLALASAVMIPIAWLSCSLIPGAGRTRQVMVAAGIAAGVVQVVGLLRWPLLVPGLADTVADPATTATTRADAIDTFQTLHDMLGGVIGESFGYALDCGMDPRHGERTPAPTRSVVRPARHLVGGAHRHRTSREGRGRARGAHQLRRLPRVERLDDRPRRLSSSAQFQTPIEATVASVEPARTVTA